MIMVVASALFIMNVAIYALVHDGMTASFQQETSQHGNHQHSNHS